MVLVLLLDLRYTSSVFSMISGRKRSLNLHFSHTKRESSKFLPVNIEPPQGISKVIGGLPNTRSIPRRGRTRYISYLATEVCKLGIGTVSHRQ